MENKKESSKLLLIIGVIVLLALIGGGLFYFFKNPKKDNQIRIDENTVVNKYTAYIKINPSIKLEYSETCTKNDSGDYDCTEPMVDSYELINEDAESIFEDINLFEKGKSLNKVIDLICERVEEKNIEFQTVEITSDWSKLNDYIEKSTETNKETENWSYSVNVATSETIKETIEQDEKKEEDNKTTTTTTTTTTKKTTTTTVIDLSQNVLYSHNMFTYVCKEPGCFSDSLISSIKNVKGSYIHSASNSEITIAYITRLSDPYNDKKFKGTAPISKIIAAGGEQQGGAGGSDEPLTMEDCKKFHLNCK